MHWLQHFYFLNNYKYMRHQSVNMRHAFGDDLVIRVCGGGGAGGGGGGTSSKYIVEMQPRWYMNLIIMNKLEL